MFPVKVVDVFVITAQSLNKIVSADGEVRSSSAANRKCL